MSLAGFLYALASVPMFASRPFLAAFMTALLARFGASIPFLADSEVVQALARSPGWFTSSTCLGVLLLLAVGEALAVKHAEVRAFMEEFDGWLKSAISMLVALAIIDAPSRETLEAIRKAGLEFHDATALVIGGLTWVVAGVRRGVVGLLAEVDDDDDIGLQSILNWVENSWTVLGILFLVVLPLVALALSALTVLGLHLFRRRARAREQRSKVPCAGCATPLLPHATRCHACERDVEAPRAVGVFGQPVDAPAEDLVRHRFALIARKRCPVCASRLRKRQVRQTCATCSTVTFAGEREFADYLSTLAERMPRTLGVCLALSAVPLVGVIPGVIYYRLTVVSGLRGYIPPLRGCLARVVVRFVNWGLIALQPIPVLGAFVIPLMCWTNYAVYRGALRGRATRDFAARGFAPESAG